MDVRLLAPVKRKTMIRLAALCAAVAASALAGTAQNPAASSAPNPAESRSAVGTIAKYDVRSHTLSLSTTTGSQSFVLTDATPIRLGSRVLKARDLADHTGAKAKVRYVEDRGKRTVESVMVSAATDAALSSDPSESGH